jgi:citrate synthase
MIVMEGKEFLTASEACQVLGVKAATLYAYVSRGLLNSYRQGIKRTRLYLRSEVEGLTELRGPGPEPASSLRAVPPGAAPSTGTTLPGANTDEPVEWIRYV